MAGRDAACSCGQLRLTAEGDPFVVSICHCLSCQRRTGSAFGVQAGFRADQVQVAGRYVDYARTSDEQDGKVHVFHFCPDCGGTVFYTEPDEADLVVVMVGTFADPGFPAPTESGYGARRHRWFDLPAGIVSDEVWAPLQPLYEAGEYAEVADRGRALVAEHPEHPMLLYNLACCESMAGRPDDAIAHLRAAIDLNEEFRSMAVEDSDFDPIRDQPAFADLTG
jgi:hypothetical protein